VTLVATTLPLEFWKFTVADGVNPVPVITKGSGEPPPSLVGVTLVIVGPVAYVYWSALLVGLTPTAFFTSTLMVPVPAGAVAVISLEDTTTTFLAS
jgi:hypothetical protein